VEADGKMVDVVAACQRVVDDAQALIETVRPEDMARPTPCAEWDVRGLINHMIGVCMMYGAVFRGEPLDPAKASTDPAGDRPAAAYAEAGAALIAAVQAPGALEGTLPQPFRELPKAVGAQIFVGDQMVHTWDLARALGRAYTMPEDLATATLELALQVPESDLRGPNAFGPAVECPPDAPVQARLLAFAGRQP
jgi:uncharacterized protein (TIGR03086 family)